MSEVKDGYCIIDAMSGMEDAHVQTSQFTDNFDKIKFLLGKNFDDYTMMIITDISGHVEVIHTDGASLIKETDESGETSLLWNLGVNVTSQTGVVIYQIAAYKKSGDTIEKTWYSKEGRLIVTESISTNEYSANLLGAYPNLLTRLLAEAEDIKTELDKVNFDKVSKEEGKGLSHNDYTDEEKEKLLSVSVGAEVNVQPDWAESDDESDAFIKNKPTLSKVSFSGSFSDLKDKPVIDTEFKNNSQNAQSGIAVAQAIADMVNSAPETLDTLSELAKALGNDPNFATTIMNLMGKKSDKTETENLIDGVTEEMNTKIGDIETALDQILKLDNELLGVSE